MLGGFNVFVTLFRRRRRSFSIRIMRASGIGSVVCVIFLSSDQT